MDFDKSRHTELIGAVNSIRSHYPWSQVTYDESRVGEVYLILSAGTMVGFIECAYKNLDLESRNPLGLFLNELHIAPGMQGKGIGFAVLEHLLSKGIPIEMVVANANAKMLALLERFNGESKYVTEHTRTVFIKPRDSSHTA